ncbi:centromere protein Chl4/mis15/CENP-N [Apiospora kogelbergensis]|uniref:centromere protein Chl4/mis15/CENP-N n=1 Tax=Apiospora kogelbergensis TaxID=1337665 RepID=UPI003130E96D
MARLSVSVPTTARLPSSLPVETSNNAVVKLLNRLSRPSLLSMVLDWLDPSNQALCPPLLQDGEEDYEDDFYPPASSLEELREIYSDMQQRKGSKREVVDRIVEGDWRKGVTLYQLAMADVQYLYDHPGSLKWTAYKFQRLKTPSSEDAAEQQAQKPDSGSMDIPRFHPSTFVQNLQAEVLPDVKAHYNLDRPPGMPLWLLRIFILDSPYNTGLAASHRTASNRAAAAATTSFDASRTIYIAFPDASPHVYLSNSQSTGTTTAGESKSLRTLVVEGIPKAMSRPRERYALRPTNLTTRNLAELLHVRGAGRANAAGGGWSIYAGDDKRTESPLNPALPTPPLSDEDPSEELANGARKKRALSIRTTHDKYRLEAKRARLVAQARFGDSAKADDAKGIERVDILVEDSFSAAGGHRGGGRRGVEDEEEEGEEEMDNDNSLQLKKPKGRRSRVDLALDRAQEGDDDDVGGDTWAWKPKIRLTFHGSHVFAGIRQLVEAGIVEGERMPGWMTGEEGVTIGAVRYGRIRGHKGSGL